MSADRIRRARPDDWTAIESLLTEADLPAAGAREHLDGFMVAEREGAIVACAALERYGGSALLRSVVVSPALRGTHLGERVVRALLDTARAEGIDSLLLLTTTAEEWFPRFGFHRVTRDAVPAAMGESAELKGACPSTAVVMRLELR